MQSIRNSILRHVRVRRSIETWYLKTEENVQEQLVRGFCTTSCPDQVIDRVIGLVKKYDNKNASKVTGAADFQKDLSLDSLDRVEIVMAIEQEFSIEIPDEEADKFACCADVAEYIISVSEGKSADKS